MFCRFNLRFIMRDLEAGRWRRAWDQRRAFLIDITVYSMLTTGCFEILARMRGGPVPELAYYLGLRVTALAAYLAALTLLGTYSAAASTAFRAELKRTALPVSVALVAASLVRFSEGHILLAGASLVASPAILLLGALFRSRLASVSRAPASKTSALLLATVPSRQHAAGDSEPAGTMDVRRNGPAENGLSLNPADAVAMISHDLIGRLAVLRASSELLLEDNLPPEEDRKLRFMMAHGVSVLDRLLHEVLGVFSPGAGQLQLQREMTNLASVCKEALAEAREVDQARHVFRLRANNLARVSIDRQKFLSMLRNLLENAAKYSPTGSKIILRVETGSDALLVSIQDEGQGIAAEHLPRIFEKSYRGVSGPDARSGSGLGLYTARRLVELHEGRIWVESQPGSGSRFTFTLPLTAGVHVEQLEPVGR
jgi:signal transduction histidine kinase